MIRHISALKHFQTHILFVLLMAASMVLAGCAGIRTELKVGRRGILINTVPDSSKVYYNNQLIGTTPCVFRFPKMRLEDTEFHFVKAGYIPEIYSFPLETYSPLKALLWIYDWVITDRGYFAVYSGGVLYCMPHKLKINLVTLTWKEGRQELIHELNNSLYFNKALIKIYEAESCPEYIEFINDDEVSNILFTRLKDENADIRFKAANVLEKGKSIPPDSGMYAYFLFAKQEWDKLIDYGDTASEPLIMGLYDDDSNIREKSFLTIANMMRYPRVARRISALFLDSPIEIVDTDKLNILGKLVCGMNPVILDSLILELVEVLRIEKANSALKLSIIGPQAAKAIPVLIESFPALIDTMIVKSSPRISTTGGFVDYRVTREFLNISHPVVVTQIRHLKSDYGNYLKVTNASGLYTRYEYGYGVELGAAAVFIDCSITYSLYLGAFALYKITGEDLGVDHEEWIKWWTNQNN